MKYPLQTDNFSLWDRTKAAFFILNKKNRLTSGPKVIELEKTWSNIAGENIKSLATSSGSTANHLLVETFLQSFDYNPENVTVFVPSTTWASSLTPWVMRGCEIVFIDINLDDFSFNYEELEKELELRKNDQKIKVIWPTALIGFIPDIDQLKSLKERFNTYLFADLCETTFGEYKNQNILSCFDMSSTSFFWAHEVCGIELGMLFINKDLELFQTIYENAQMIRSHGLTRVISKNSETRKNIESKYSDVDPEFLFAKIGTNYRATDLNAMFCLLDSKRVEKYKKLRKNLWKYIVDNLPNDYIKLNKNIIPFCLPFLSTVKNINEVKKNLNLNGWETRPIICYLPINPAFEKYSNKKDYPNSKFLHDNGFYIGLNKDIKIKDIKKLFKIIS